MRCALRRRQRGNWTSKPLNHAMIRSNLGHFFRRRTQACSSARVISQSFE
jgi:hypothetical protein